MSLIHEFTGGTVLDLAFPSSAEDIYKALLSAQKPVPVPRLPFPERTLPHRCPNTPDRSPASTCFHPNRVLARVNHCGATPRVTFHLDDGSASRMVADERLPVVELHPFHGKEWRPSKSFSMPSVSIHSSNDLSRKRSSYDVSTSGGDKLKPSETGADGKVTLKGPKSKKPEVIFTRQKTTIKDRHPFPPPFPVTVEQFPSWRNKSENGKRAMTSPVLRRIHPAKSCSLPERNAGDLPGTGFRNPRSSPSPGVLCSSDYWEGQMRQQSSLEGCKKSEIFAQHRRSTRGECHRNCEVLDRSKTLDSFSLAPARLRQRRSRGSVANHKPIPYRSGMVNNLYPLNRENLRPLGVESQLAYLLRVTLEETRRAQPACAKVKAAPTLKTYKTFVRATPGEERLQSGRRHNTVIIESRTRERKTESPEQQPQRNYTLPNFFPEDDDERSGRTFHTKVANLEPKRETLSEERRTYNSRNTSRCSQTTNSVEIHTLEVTSREVDAQDSRGNDDSISPGSLTSNPNSLKKISVNASSQDIPFERRNMVTVSVTKRPVELELEKRIESTTS